jgi:DNA-directed RNA polymerase specialized sigma24 family protein
MFDDFRSCTPDERQLDDELLWRALRAWLLPRVRTWVYTAHVVIWRRQQDDIVEDITQEAITRTFVSIQKAKKNKDAPIVHPYAFCNTTARHIFVDRIRKENRLVHFVLEEGYHEPPLLSHELNDPESIALDHLMLEEDVVLVAQFIARSPAKQRAALLAHLAKNMDFDASPSLLEQALATAGIHLRAYARTSFEDAGEVSRQSALLWHVRKRLKKEYKVTCF